ncbi:TPA: NADH-quinone oxidoreductase subunit C [Legionella pneumophila subsp. pneumophila]|uniref:NADH-quinone oxidoreductase subunit C n=1 Tax=Legionella pneumophila (strain Lens) TaxID=297245 RepID=NUOC_LEGPL|nr:NADH-quinone oxidoreductase subunit C [Legionella pneumophila]Q5WT22.1 RecName: Full=NADH-quinone oxidoreductase subunit C; AltName: Full=NADH dehydrogenase I subunit C; AltName: Full=NDH-1 subunit C [Legionella pneumophila str. Lens]AOW53466.1 NADH-quinone oxidoreductase subunit C [Legionella pneumophila subsp. pneumophila]AOW55637.1 NADH-quinone oxidoreductase subunit C [Legionella pneumophila subsp. pneumophila]AOW58802.1 NADH-quinone oxidoreductase subunit C [Legionella pneumophila subsp
MTKNEYLIEKLQVDLANHITELTSAYGEVTIECEVQNLLPVMIELRDREEFSFDELIDLCGVDYLHYGDYDWETESATEHGFSRGVERQEAKAYAVNKPRFAVVYHLLSTKKNHRLRVKLFVEESHLIVPSVHHLWKSANWFEREAYDLYGILFDGHPDLRRLLTDYGFIGHPFRKDFPLSGEVEMRYDAKLQKVIYAPVDIVPRIVVPKVIRNDNRYIGNEGSKND